MDGHVVIHTQARQPENKLAPLFGCILGLLFDYLRECRTAHREVKYILAWQDNLSDPHREYLRATSSQRSHATADYLMVDSAIKVLNALNRHFHYMASRILSHSMTFSQRFSTDRLRRMYEEPYVGAFGLLRSKTTHSLSINDKLFETDEHFLGLHLRLEDDLITYDEHRRRFDLLKRIHGPERRPLDLDSLLDAVSASSPSLKVFRYVYDCHTTLPKSARAFERLLRCLPHLEELIVENDGTGHFLQILHSEPSLLTQNKCLSRVLLIGFAIQDLRTEKNGLPITFAPLLAVETLTEVHFHSPFRHRGVLSLLRNLSWIRTTKEREFEFDSVCIRAGLKTNLNFSAVPNEESILEGLKRAPNVVFQVPYCSATKVASQFFPIWPSLNSLTVVSDDFPYACTKFLPSSCSTLDITFEPDRCRTPPNSTDTRLLKALEERREMKIVRISLAWRHEPRSPISRAFAVPSDELFLRSRLTCTERGGNLTLENLYLLP